MKINQIVLAVIALVLFALVLNFGLLADEEELGEAERAALDRGRRGRRRAGRAAVNATQRHRRNTRESATVPLVESEEVVEDELAGDVVVAEREGNHASPSDSRGATSPAAPVDVPPYISDIVSSSFAWHSSRLAPDGATDSAYWLGGAADDGATVKAPPGASRPVADRADPRLPFLSPHDELLLPLPLSVGLPVMTTPSDSASLALGAWWNWSVDEPASGERKHGAPGTEVGGFSCGLRDVQAARVAAPAPLYLDPTHTAIIVDDSLINDRVVAHTVSLVEATFTSAVHEFRATRSAQREAEARLGKNERRRRRKAREATAARAGSSSFIDWYVDYVPVKEATLVDASTRLASAARARAGIPTVSAHRSELENANVFQGDASPHDEPTLANAEASYTRAVRRLTDSGVADRLLEVEEEEEERERELEAEEGVDDEGVASSAADGNSEATGDATSAPDLIYSANGVYWMSMDAAEHEPLRLLIGPVPAGTLVQKRSDAAGPEAASAAQEAQRAASVTAWLSVEWMRIHSVAAICLVSGESLRAVRAGDTVSVCEELRDSARLPVLYLDVDGAAGLSEGAVREAVRRFVLRADVAGLAGELASTSAPVKGAYRGERLRAPPPQRAVEVPSLSQGGDCADRLSSSHCPPLFIVGGEMKCGTLAVPTLLQAKLPSALLHRDAVMPLHRILGNATDPDELEVGGGEDDFWSNQITRGLRAVDVLSDTGLVPASVEAAAAIAAYLRFSYLTWTKDPTSLRLMPRSDWRAGSATWEKSPSYLKAPMAPSRVAALLPGTHLIFLLCDPIRRTHTRWFDGHVKHALRDSQAKHSDKVALKRQFVRPARHALQGPTALEHTRVLLTALTEPSATRAAVDRAVRQFEGWADDMTAQGVAFAASLAAKQAACLERHRRGKLVLPQVYSLLANRTSPAADTECAEIVRRVLDARTPTVVNVTHLLPRSHAEQTYALLADAALGTTVGGALSILTGAHFAPSLERWLRVQGKDRVHVLDSEAVVANADATLTPVLQTIGARTDDIVSLGHQSRGHHFNKPFPFMEARTFQALSAYYCRSFVHLSFLVPESFGQTWLAKVRPPLEAIPVYSDKETQRAAEEAAANFTGVLVT